MELVEVLERKAVICSIIYFQFSVIADQANLIPWIEENDFG